MAGHTTYLESGLSVRLPAARHFRFAVLNPYIHLKGRSLKEMDFAWCVEEDGRRTLVLLEVKRYEDLPDDPAARLLETLRAKVTDALLMLLAAWAGTRVGRALREEFPGCVTQPPHGVRVVLGLEFPANRQAHLTFLHDVLRRGLSGRLTLANAGTLEVVDFDTLTARFPTIVSRHEQESEDHA